MPSTFRIVCVLLAGSLAAGPALADRHCLPAEDGYFDARLHLQKEELTCGAAVSAARADLADAIANARICGCSELVDTLEGLRDLAKDETVACAERKQSLLDAEGVIKDTVYSCHR